MALPAPHSPAKGSSSYGRHPAARPRFGPIDGIVGSVNPDEEDDGERFSYPEPPPEERVSARMNRFLYASPSRERAKARKYQDRSTKPSFDVPPSGDETPVQPFSPSDSPLSGGVAQEMARRAAFGPTKEAWSPGAGRLSRGNSRGSSGRSGSLGRSPDRRGSELQPQVTRCRARTLPAVGRAPKLLLDGLCVPRVGRSQGGGASRAMGRARARTADGSRRAPPPPTHPHVPLAAHPGPWPGPHAPAPAPPTRPKAWTADGPPAPEPSACGPSRLQRAGAALALQPALKSAAARPVRLPPAHTALLLGRRGRARASSGWRTSTPSSRCSTRSRGTLDPRPPPPPPTPAPTSHPKPRPKPQRDPKPNRSPDTNATPTLTPTLAPSLTRSAFLGPSPERSAERERRGFKRRSRVGPQPRIERSDTAAEVSPAVDKDITEPRRSAGPGAHTYGVARGGPGKPRLRNGSS